MRVQSGTLFLPKKCYTTNMPKKKSRDMDQPVTQRQFEDLVDTIRDMGGHIMEVIKDFRLEQKHNWEEQRQFNQEISQKVDMNTDSIRELDQKVRYQNDMPERLEHVENQQYELTRRVTALEKN